MNILIVGGKGFIGSAIASSLKANHAITILDNFSFEYPVYKYIVDKTIGLKLTPGLEILHRLSAKKYRDSLISSIKTIDKAGYEDYSLDIKFDLVINCGSLSESSLSPYFQDFTEKSILDSLANLVSNHNCPIFHFSDLSVYGNKKETIEENTELNPTELFGACKKASESLLNLNKDIILRVAKVYGYGDGNLPLPMLLERHNNKILIVEESNVIYIKDLIVLINKIINNWMPGIYNVSSGYTLNNEIIQQQAKSLNFKVEITTDNNEQILNLNKIKTIYNWEPNYKTYEESIIDYFNTYTKEQ